MAGRIYWKDGVGLFASQSEVGLADKINVKPVTVPSDFLGITTHRWPVISTGFVDCAAPTFQFGSLRTHDSSCDAVWAHVNTAPGVYNWTTVDAFMAGTTGPVCWTIYGCPSWAASVDDRAIKDAYYISGGGAAPTDPNMVTGFVTAFMNRYPTRVKWIEIWNEPSFQGPQATLQGGIPTSANFYWGTMVQLVALGNAIRNAAKAVNSNVIILSPGFVGNIAGYKSDPYKWLTTVDPVSGKRGLDVIDAFAYHNYGCGVTGNNDMISDPYCGVEAIRSMLGSLHFQGDIYITECGMDRIGGGSNNEFSLLTAPQRANRVASTLMAAAAAGIKAVFVYSYQSNLTGDLVNDTSGAIAGMNLVHNSVAGKTIVARGGVAPGDGTVSLTLSTAATVVSGSALEPMTSASAARLLDQAQFGVRPEEVTALVAQGTAGYSAWIEDQFTKELSDPTNFYTETGLNGYDGSGLLSENWLRREALRSNAQLKARCVHALQNFIVMNNFGTAVYPTDTAPVAKCFRDNAFGNFRTLLYQMSTSHQMAKWLTFFHNEKATSTTQPDENYAREVMQLFSIGLWELNEDATHKLSGQLDPSDPRYVLGGTNDVQSYGQSDVRGLARVFTGLGSNDGVWGGTPPQGSGLSCSFFDDHHEMGTKEFLGTTIPINTGAQASVNIAIDTLFNHPNTPPFFCKQMIQRLVTSNPSPAYVQRVVNAFKNNGSGVRGDLKAVWRAILLDTEARSSVLAAQPTYGKLREAEIAGIGLIRTLVNEPVAIDALLTQNTTMNWGGVTSAFRPPSVFNFFTPFFQTAGYLKENGLVAPEMQTYGENSALNFMTGQIGVCMQLLVSGALDGHGVTMSVSSLEAVRTDSAALLDLCCQLYQAKFSDARRTEIINHLNTIGSDAISYYNNTYERVLIAMSTVVSSPERMVQK